MYLSRDAFPVPDQRGNARVQQTFVLQPAGGSLYFVNAAVFGHSFLCFSNICFTLRYP